MALNIKSAKVDRLARTLAARTGETITQAVERALEERLMREEGRRASPSLEEEILEIARRCAGLPDLDTRSADEILGYDENGLPR